MSRNANSAKHASPGASQSALRSSRSHAQKAKHPAGLPRQKATASDDAELPEGAQPFEANLPAGQIFRHTFATPGRYDYVCDPHEVFGMHGRVIVTPAE